MRSKNLLSRIVLLTAGALSVAVACNLPQPTPDLIPAPPEPGLFATPIPAEPTATPEAVLTLLPATAEPGVVPPSPTPDPIREPPAAQVIPESYVVQAGDTLNRIAERFGLSAQQLAIANGIVNPNMLYVGQVLMLPTPIPLPPGPSYKVLPDSELVYGPASTLFDLRGFTSRWDSALVGYRDVIEGREVDGPEMVQLVAQRYSVNPGLLLAVLEYQAGWVTRAQVPTDRFYYPVGYVSAGREGMFAQLSWTADQLNTGYYLWRAGWAGPYRFAEGNVPPGPGINAGTAAVGYLFSQLYPADMWRGVMDEAGFAATYRQLFGDPFARAIEPLVPADLSQPELRLPIEDGTVWSFTGGPHSAWGIGAAWAALDFAPPGYALGCTLSPEWVVAAADGRIVRAEYGEVIQDLDGDGREQTGWALLYLHIESQDRVAAGSYLKAGDRIGHPSCEGGVSNGTHLHFARKYNGEWIPADGPIPFVLDGWQSSGTGIEYDGMLTRGGDVLVACGCRNDENQVRR